MSLRPFQDLERATEEKTSSVHFLRFELDECTVLALKSRAAMSLGAEHPDYTETMVLPAAARDALVKDLA